MMSSSSSWFPLEYCVETGNTAILIRVLDDFPQKEMWDIFDYDTYRYNNLIVMAIGNSHPETAKFLIKRIKICE